MESNQTSEKVYAMQERLKKNDIERQKRNRNTARKIAQLLVESQAKFDDIQEIFRTSTQFLTVSFSESEKLLDVL